MGAEGQASLPMTPIELVLRPVIVSVVVTTPVTVDEGGDDADHGEHEDDGKHPSMTNQSQQVGQDT